MAERWEQAEPELERIRREELRAYQYDPQHADALLEMGDHYDGTPATSSGLVEMQRLFMMVARQQGLLPAAKEEKAPYDAVSQQPSAPKKKPNKKQPNRPRKEI